MVLVWKFVAVITNQIRFGEFSFSIIAPTESGHAPAIRRLAH